MPPGDVIYSANAAFLSYPEEFSRFPYRVVVASTTVLAKGLGDHDEDHAVYRMKVDAIRDICAEQLVLLADPGRANHIDSIRQYLTAGRPHERRMRVYSVRERMQLVRRLVGSYPLLERNFISQPLPIAGPVTTAIAGIGSCSMAL